MDDKHKTSQAGFSLIEMTTVTGIMVIAAGIVVGDFVRAGRRQRLEGAASQVVTDLRLARSAAVNHNLDVQMTFDNAADEYTMWIDRNRNGTAETGETVVRGLEGGVDLWCYPDRGTFKPQGTFSCTHSFFYVQVRMPNGSYKALHLTPNGHIGNYLPILGDQGTEGEG